MANIIDQMFVTVINNGISHELICEVKLPNGNWIKVEIIFDPIKRTTVSELPHTYQPTGLEPRAFFEPSLKQYGSSIVLSVSKAIQNYETDVLPHFEEAFQILSEHGFPMEEAERLCV